MGAGGHAKVVADLAIALGGYVTGVCDPVLVNENHRDWQGFPVLGGDDYLLSVLPQDVWLLNGVGKMPGNKARAALYVRFRESGFRFPPLIHPRASVAPSAVVHEGSQVMAGAIIQAGAEVGCNAIVNSASSVDHDSCIGAHAHVAPGVTVCGNVTIGEHAFIGAGATIIQGVILSANCFIKAGSLVIKDRV
nr:acetyltransferase [Marinobacter koreensis]